MHLKAPLDLILLWLKARILFKLCSVASRVASIQYPGKHAISVTSFPESYSMYGGTGQRLPYPHGVARLLGDLPLQEAWTNLGSLLRDWGKGEKALGAFDNALSLDTAYVHAYHLRGLCKHGMGHHKGAQADFMRGLFYDAQVSAFCVKLHRDHAMK